MLLFFRPCFFPLSLPPPEIFLPTPLLTIKKKFERSFVIQLEKDVNSILVKEKYTWPKYEGCSYPPNFVQGKII